MMRTALYTGSFDPLTNGHLDVIRGGLGLFDRLVVAIGVHVSLRAESDRVQPQRISAKLMPPFLLMKSPVAPDAFFKDSLALKPKLEEERKKEPSSGGFFMGDFD